MKHSPPRASWDYKTLATPAAEASGSIVLSVAHHAANNLTLGTGQDSSEAASQSAAATAHLQRRAAARNDHRKL